MLEGVKLEYAKPLAKILDCDSDSWKYEGSSSNVKEYQLSGAIDPGKSLIYEVSLNDNSGGSLRLSGKGMVFDLVGWGNSISQGVCKEGTLAPLPANGKIIKRKIDRGSDSDKQIFIDTDDNGQDFSDKEDDQNIQDPSKVDDDISGKSNDNILQDARCQNISISEILPNPAGSDSGVEYIELFNSINEPIQVIGCILRVGNSSKKLDGSIAPGYTVFTGLVLPNASGAAVEFITSETEEVVSYPAGLGDDQSWALIDGVWQITDKPTPGAENELFLKVEDAIDKTTNNSSDLEVCPARKYRNPETNRCKSLETTNELKPCGQGQIRSLETNRCKSTQTLVASLKPCQQGQVRNPETNRCRKIAGSISLAECKEGQERNPDTNRCRKVASATTASSNNVLADEIESKQKISYGVFGAMALLILGYGIYEYRVNIANFFAKVKK